MKRRTVNFGDSEYMEIAPFIDEEGPERAMLADAVGEAAPLYSDSAALRALMLLGARSLRARMLDHGYAKLAEWYGAEEIAAAEASLEDVADVWDG
jgi:hypothetical protein